MKRNSITLTLISLIIGAIITLGLNRYDANGHIAKVEPCDNAALSTLPKNLDCNAWQRGYPFPFLHSQVSGDTYNGTASANKAGMIWSNPWIEFKPATADWLIWSVVSAAGIGMLVYLLERAGMSTGFTDKKKRR